MQKIQEKVNPKCFRYAFYKTLPILTKFGTQCLEQIVETLFGILGEVAIVLCGKFIQNAMYQFLSESAEFCRRYDENISAYFFPGRGDIPVYYTRR